MRAWIHSETVIRNLKRSWMVLAFLIIFAAIISSVFRALTPLATQYKSGVEEHLSRIMGKSVSISRMETGWYWFEPVVRLDQVLIQDGDEKLRLRKILIGINILSSLWHWQIQPGVLYADSVHLVLREKNGHWGIEGLEDLGDSSLRLDDNTWKPVLAWVFSRQKMIVRRISADIYWQDNRRLSVKELNLVVARYGSLYYLKGNVLFNSNPASLRVLGEISLDPDSLQSRYGRVFLSAEALPLPLTLEMLKETPLEKPPVDIRQGDADIQVWLDWKKGVLKNMAGRLGVRDLVWIDPGTPNHKFLPWFNANLAWNATRQGWTLSGDHIRMAPGTGETTSSAEKNRWGNKKPSPEKPAVVLPWPENRIKVDYVRETATWQLYVAHLIPESLLSLSENWPKEMQPILAMKPYGLMEDTECHIQDGKPSYFLSRFSGLGWQAFHDIPKMANLSGVLYWQPEEGRLELDGENTTIGLPGKTPLIFASLNGALDWKKLSHGWHLSLDRLVLERPDLLLGGSGSVDGITPDSVGQLDLTLQLSAHDAGKWLAFLPKKHLKPKLLSWLEQDIGRIGGLTAEINIHGQAKEFPFDSGPGDFLIKAHVEDMDVRFGNPWPWTKEVEAFLSFDKRALDINIVHGLLQDIPVQNANIKITDIGLDREVLLARTRVDAPAEKSSAYVLSSPLRGKLAFLNQLHPKGNMSLDLQLEVPLYPENDQVLVQGNLDFKEAGLSIPHAPGNLGVDSLNGTLHFDEEGVRNSAFSARLLNYPLRILMTAARNAANPSVEIEMDGSMSVEALQPVLAFPLTPLVHGTFVFQSMLKLAAKGSDLKSMSFKTSLEGTGIDLPAPFGKPAGRLSPLSVDLDFGPERLTVRGNYDDRMNAEFLFTGHSLRMKKGEVHLGRGKFSGKKETGFQITGVLPVFDWSEWEPVWKKLPAASEENSAGFVDLVDVLFKKFIIHQEEYPDAALRLEKLSGDEWAIGLHQENVAANLRYQWRKRFLSGSFQKLRLKSSELKEPSSGSFLSSLSVADMPALDLTINQLEWNDSSLGDIALKASRKKDAWSIDTLTVTSDRYLLRAEGSWFQKGRESLSKWQANLEINDLAKTLERFHVTPAVEAHKGILWFQGSWPGAFYDFSLKNVTGNMSISFKNGRITHLSPETEEKLGLGKLLSILSLQTIPRRLTLDFSDLAHTGYSFDEFKGDFIVAHGLMSTENSSIDGPIAYASIKGDLDIAKQLYNLELRISPHVTASLPVVATIAGGPVAGVATWVVSKIINQGMQKISGYTYKISGPWKQPVIQQVTIIKKTGR